MQENPAKRLLNSAADTLIVGLLVTVCSIPLITAYAAFRAGVLALRVDDGGLLGRYIRHLRVRIGRNLLTGALFLFAAAIAAADLAFVLIGQARAAGVGVGTAGVVLFVVVAVGPGFSAALEAGSTGAFRERLLHLVLAGAKHPLRCLALIIATLAGGLAVAFAPILAPLVAGILARIASRIPASELVLAPTA